MQAGNTIRVDSLGHKLRAKFTEAESARRAREEGWLDDLRLRHGVAPATLSVARSEGQLRVQAGFDVAR